MERLKPAIPKRKDLGPLKDMAQEVTTASARLEGSVAPETALAMGMHMRLVNSHYSNLIEGYRATFPDIEHALGTLSMDTGELSYAQELAAAHVNTEIQKMQDVMESPSANVSTPGFLCGIHSHLFNQLPEHHRFTHEGFGFTRHCVMPGELRDLLVTVGSGQRTLGPGPDEVHACLAAFGRRYDLARFHGDERLIAVAAGHHRLAWIHPFRDGNGRVCRLHSSLAMAVAMVNRDNLWSLSRGLSRNQSEYMTTLAMADYVSGKKGKATSSERLADFCAFFLNTCLEEIHFLQLQLRLEEIEQRIEWYVGHRAKAAPSKRLHKKSAWLLRALFMRGSVERGEGPTLLNVSETTYRRIVRQLLKDGLVASDSPKAPLRFALPSSALPFYFPALFMGPLFGPSAYELPA